MIRKYPTFLIGGYLVFSFNTDSLGLLYYQSFEGVNWTLVLNLFSRGYHQGLSTGTEPVF